MPAALTLNPTSPGARLRRARNRAGLTQNQLGDLTDLGQYTISRWERGEGAPDMLDAIVLSEHLGVSVETIARWYRTGTTGTDSSWFLRAPEPVAA